MDDAGLTLRQLRYLVSLADAGHFRIAAERCGVTQPSLSAQLKNLEQTLGVQLVERGHGGTTLTPTGREVVDRARRILLDVRGLRDAASASVHRLAGTIRLGVKSTLGPYLLPQIVAVLHREYRDLKLYVREGAPHSLADELSRGVHDVILAQLPLVSADLVVERLFREPIYLALAIDHPLAGKAAIGAADLAGLPVLSLSPDFHLHDQVHAICEEFGARLVRDYEGTSLDALRQMVAMDMGVTFVPALYAHSEIVRSGDVVARPLIGRAIYRSIGLVWRRGAGQAGAYARIAEIVRDVARRSFPMLTIER